MQTIKKIGVLSFAKIQAILMLAFGLISALLTIIISQMQGTLTPEPLMLWVIRPLIVALAGFILGAIGALIYNLLEPTVGGIKIELEED
jgi:hypothetical protein